MRIIVWLSFVVTLLLQAQTSVWKVSKGSNTLYIGGTFHMLRQSDYPLPSAFSSAYNKATVVAFETDLSAMNDPMFSMQMMGRLMQPQGKSLRDDLDKKTYMYLKKYALSKKIPMSMLDTMRPQMVVITLMMGEMQALGVDTQGVDAFYNAKALREKKTLKFFETPEEQLSFIAHMGAGHENEMIRQTIEDMNQIETMLEEMIRAWRDGDLKSMQTLALDSMKNDYPELFQILVVNRNDAWMPKIEAMFQNSDTEFVLVGTLHLVGKEGVLERLKAKGYKITQL